MTLQNAQEQVDQWIKTIGVRYFSELTNMAILTEEVGELARHMARTYGDQSYREKDLSPSPSERAGVRSDPSPLGRAREGIADEMADVLWVLICLANQTGVNLTEAFEKNMEKKTNRDKDRHQNNPKLH